MSLPDRTAFRRSLSISGETRNEETALNRKWRTNQLFGNHFKIWNRSSQTAQVKPETSIVDGYRVGRLAHSPLFTSRRGLSAFFGMVRVQAQTKRALLRAPFPRGYRGFLERHAQTELSKALLALSRVAGVRRGLTEGA